MKELEPVYATDYTMDILGDRKSKDVTDIPARDGDLYQIRPTEVGY